MRCLFFFFIFFFFFSGDPHICLLRLNDADPNQVQGHKELR